MESYGKQTKKRSFHVMIPKRVAKSTNIDLQISLVTLKNSIASLTIYATKIERELAKRNIHCSIIEAARMPIPDNDIAEYHENTESATAL